MATECNPSCLNCCPLSAPRCISTLAGQLARVCVCVLLTILVTSRDYLTFLCVFVFFIISSECLSSALQAPSTVGTAKGLKNPVKVSSLPTR